MLNDRILINAGARGASLVALKKTDGSTLWQSGNEEAGYSSAVLHTVGGVPQAIYFTAQRAVGVDVRDGRQLWSYAKVANRTANIATPIVRGNRVFLSSDYGTGAALLELTPAGGSINAREVYFTNEMRNHHASSVLIGEHLYTGGQPDPDLVIRTSGEQRISDFMLWQSAHSEFYFVEALGPDLREVDFLRALRDFSRRQRRFGQ